MYFINILFHFEPPYILIYWSALNTTKSKLNHWNDFIHKKFLFFDLRHNIYYGTLLNKFL